MSKAFDRKLDRLHRQHVREAPPGPSTLSARDFAIWEWKRWNFAVLTPEGLKAAASLSEEDWRIVEYQADYSVYSATFVMPGTPLPERRPAPAPAVPLPIPPTMAPPAPEPARAVPQAPPPSAASPGPPQIADAPFLNGGSMRWVPRYEADAQRACDYADCIRRQNREMESMAPWDRAEYMRRRH